MQAARQCSVCARCAVGGLVRNQTDFSQLQRRGVASIRFLSSSESRRSTVHRPADLTNPTNVSLASLSLGHGLWQVENLSHDSLIRRAASVVTDSSSTFLSQATLALSDALTDYSKAVHSRIAFQKRYLSSLGKLSPAEEGSLQQSISSWRAEAAERQSECKRYETTWNSAVNLCKIAADAAYSSGAQQASISIRTNIKVAESQLEEARKLSAEAEKKLAETKVEEIERMAEYAAFLEGSDEYEIQEAYLRED
ncbi:diablo homolog, mitochondrial isoform X1 [Oryzias melastigma]|uniref:diablo homolog, mitochondrial isoform X1 n=1 Tax=Oryzias melastigma TaxID=30732 RepID=UPI000CF7CA94|nr:diablo homolog, mitochondrial isoform X1 [Oryzias melastigma]